MNEQDKKNTAPTIFYAVNEKFITPLELLQEVQPLLKQFFIGNFKIENNAIKMRFLNGQKFRLTIGEVNQ